MTFRSLLLDLENRGEVDHIRRIRGLMTKGVSHSWLWNYNPRHGAVLSEDDFLINLQKRVNARIITDDVKCAKCGLQLDAQCWHCETCGSTARTRGHYATVRACVTGFAVGDPSTTTETPGLTRTAMRPADILTTSALPGRSAALDVTIVSPEAGSAGTDALSSAYRAKLRKYEEVIPEMRREGVDFQPMVWTSDGVPHPSVIRILNFAAGIAVSKRAAKSKKAFMRHWMHQITIQILRRRAAMVRECLPKAEQVSAFDMPGRAEPFRATGYRGEGKLKNLDTGPTEYPDLRDYLCIQPHVDTEPEDELPPDNEVGDESRDAGDEEMPATLPLMEEGDGDEDIEVEDVDRTGLSFMGIAVNTSGVESAELPSAVAAPLELDPEGDDHMGAGEGPAKADEDEEAGAEGEAEPPTPVQAAAGA